MRPFAALALLAALARPAPDDPLPEDVAAAHAEGKWRVRTTDLYHHLARYYGRSPEARAVLDAYVKQRFVEAESRRRGVIVTDEDVERYVADVARQVLQKTGGKTTLDEALAQEGITRAEMRRRTRTFMQRERLARDEFRKKDPTRDPKRELDESEIGFCVDQLFQMSEKQLDSKKLPPGVVAVVSGAPITEYDFGRELALALDRTAVADALGDLVLVEETKLLVGERWPPAPEVVERHKAWFVEAQKATLSHRVKDSALLTDDVVRQIVERNGLTLEEFFASPGFLAEAAARDHFLRSMDEERLRAYYEEKRARYGDRVRVARIVVQARAQREVRQAGKPIRTLEQGKALADALYLRVTQGEDFAKVARENSDDADELRRSGGESPGWVTADRPGWEESFAAARDLKVGEISRPVYSRVAGGAFQLVKLLERKPGPSFEEIADRVRRDAGHDAYVVWRKQRLKACRKSEALLEGE